MKPVSELLKRPRDDSFKIGLRGGGNAHRPCALPQAHSGLSRWLLRQHSIPNCFEVTVDIGGAVEGPITAALDISNANTRSFPQGLYARLGVFLLVLDEAQPLPHHFARVLIAALFDESLDKFRLTICEYDVARRHGPRPSDW